MTTPEPAIPSKPPRKRTENWTEEQLDSIPKSNSLGMLTIVESILPYGNNQWEQVASRYNALLPAAWSPRIGESLKRKFNALKNVKKPTGLTFII